MTTDLTVRTLRVRPLGGSTAILELGGLRVITDPTFDPPGARGGGLPSRTTGPALDPADLGPLDVALVSHDQHPDNLDGSGRALLADVRLVLTTRAGAQRLGGTVRGLEPFEAVEVESRDGARVTITALPAQHGPEGAEAVLGPVVGFLLAGDGLPTVYVSGDNASVDVVRAIVAEVGEVDIAVLHVGGASTPRYFDGALLTLGSAGAAQAAKVLGARAVVPIHWDGWTHYSQSRGSLATAFAAAGLSDVLKLAAPGEAVEL
jgi:L-ascorbate metabolism protein UlaG (beta-lactamase superfamily)